MTLSELFNTFEAHNWPKSLKNGRNYICDIKWKRFLGKYIKSYSSMHYYETDIVKIGKRWFEMFYIQ